MWLKEMNEKRNARRVGYSMIYCGLKHFSISIVGSQPRTNSVTFGNCKWSNTLSEIWSQMKFIIGHIYTERPRVRAPYSHFHQLLHLCRSSSLVQYYYYYKASTGFGSIRVIRRIK